MHSYVPDFVERAVTRLMEEDEKYVVAWHEGNGQFAGVGYWSAETGELTKNVTPEIRKYCVVLEGYIESLMK